MNDNIDWKEVESKISLICNRFSNLKPWHEDLAQELRIHAYYVSDDYYDLYRKAIDFWRTIQVRQSPEVPYFDLEVLNPASRDTSNDELSFEELVKLIRRELDRPGNNKSDTSRLDLARRLLEIIIRDINPEALRNTSIEELDKFDKSGLNHYINSRVNLTWVSKETGVSYRKLIIAMRILEDIVRGLAAMRKIDLPREYFKGYYEDED